MNGLGERFVCAAAACALLAALPVCASACTTFVLRTPNGTYFGRNYDFGIGDGMLVTNKRGLAKQAALDGPGDTPAQWVSRYGSLTFNQFGREFPQGGMNEAGMVVELMWLDGTKYPARDARPAVSELGWIQFMLDNCATVREAIDGAQRVRIAGNVPIHFLVADKSGASASMEFLDGKLVVHEGDRLPFAVLANDSYDASIAYLKKHEGFGGYAPLAGSPSSLDRFCRAAAKVKSYRFAKSGSPVDYAFGILSDVAQQDYTRWSIVYDTAKGVVYYRTKEHSEIKRVSLDTFDLSCATPVKVYDLAAAGDGDVGARFVDYTRAANRNLIGRSFAGVDFLKGVPAQALDQFAAYPEALPCAK